MTATEIQNIQIADGDVCRELPIPIYMIFPRLFTCPSLTTSNFKIGKLFIVNYEQTVLLIVFVTWHTFLILSCYCLIMASEVVPDFNFIFFYYACIVVWM